MIDIKNMGPEEARKRRERAYDNRTELGRVAREARSAGQSDEAGVTRRVVGVSERGKPGRLRRFLILECGHEDCAPMAVREYGLAGAVGSLADAPKTARCYACSRQGDDAPLGGQIMRSRTTGVLVRKTGPGSDPRSFAGVVIGKPPQFCFSWHGWNAENFDEV